MKHRKALIDLEFLTTCSQNGLIPNFLKFRVANYQLRNSKTYRVCQTRLLNEEISNKKSKIRQHKTEHENLKCLLHNTLSFIDYTHVCTMFLVSNDKIINKQRMIHNKKLQKLGFEYSCNSHDPDKVIFNFSSHILSESEKSLLSKGLNFSIPPRKLNYADTLIPFELLYRDVNGLELDNLTKEIIKTRMKDTAFSMYNDYDGSKENNLTTDEVSALRTLITCKDIIIQKSDKGNSVVLVDKNTYVNKIKSLLTDSGKFEKMEIPPGKDYNYIHNQEKRISNSLKSLFNKKVINKELYNKLCPTGSKPGVLYGLAKVHKKSVNGSPPFRPILSAIGISTYNLAQFLVTLLSPLTSNEFTVKDSFEFAENIRLQNPDLYMTSLDVDSLFTNLPLDETIDICVNSLFENTDKVNGLSKEDVYNLLNLATKESFFMFDQNYYKQIDGVAMGSPLGPTLANIFLCYHEKVWLSQCPAQFKPLYYRRYVDDIFLLFKSKEHIDLHERWT